MNEIVYLNGSLLPLNEARISPVDYGFLFGFGLFETMRAYDGKVFRLDKHLNRLACSAKTLGLPAITLDLEKAVKGTLIANKLSDARIRITVSAGEGGIVPDPAGCTGPTVLITSGHYQPYTEQVYEKGFKAVISSIRRNSQSPLSRLKSMNYLENLLAKREAKAAGADEALFLNERDLVAEAAMSNIFIVSGGILKTPRVENGILPGITREIILELAPKLGIETVADDIWLDDLFEAEEAFLTNSVMEVMPLVKVAGKRIGSGKPGPVTKKLQEAYRELVKSE
ncbi:MAG: aminotransferase class IV [Dehalococcoidales bacterium]|nr:aminotransferase class IV [Dehalococcoidales bacterium]